MDDADDSRLAARLINNSTLRLLPVAERWRIAAIMDDVSTFDDLPLDVGLVVDEALDTMPDADWASA